MITVGKQNSNGGKKMKRGKKNYNSGYLLFFIITGFLVGIYFVMYGSIPMESVEFKRGTITYIVVVLLVSFLLLFLFFSNVKLAGD